MIFDYAAIFFLSKGSSSNGNLELPFFFFSLNKKNSTNRSCFLKHVDFFTYIQLWIWELWLEYNIEPMVFRSYTLIFEYSWLKMGVEGFFFCQTMFFDVHLHI